MARDTYEVYYHQNGRWQLHASFETGEREVAVQEASMVSTKEGYATRVVRETFYPETNTTEDVVAWQSPKAKQMGDSNNMFGFEPDKRPQRKGPQRSAQSKRATPQPGGGSHQQEATQRGGTHSASSLTSKGAKKKKVKKIIRKGAPQSKVKRKRRKKKSSGIFRIIMTLIISVSVAAISAAAMALIITQLVAMDVLTRANRLPLINGTFISVFFLSTFVNLQKYFNILGMLSMGPRHNIKAAGPERMMAVVAGRKSKTKAPAQDVEFDKVVIERTDESSPKKDGPAELDTHMDTQVGEKQKEDTPEKENAAKSEVKQKKEEEKGKKKKADSKATRKSPAETEVSENLGYFLEDAVSSISTVKLNTFTRFGLNLYVAGAASVAGQSKRLGRDEQLTILKDSLVSAGSNSASATSFCVELPSHGKNPRYAGMIKSGSQAMTQYMGGTRNIVPTLDELLNDWNLPDKRPAVPSVITFVFTDIVGSTAMTQKLGNAGAQKAVRAHNDAVRSAISAQKGREVKHTGDGIMATFPSPPAAVAATISMQRAVAAHNSKNPNIQVHIRIGINAGEAVEEENDFFGAAVQMTARICDKASTANIWVSQTIVDSCKGQKFGFIPRGGFDMKGIQGRKPLYEVGWSDTHKNELADL
ncbi:MAG TPA: hypothetical protein DGZ24_07190 [Rhodospirillaceae bacterium]|nr:hypothetical protein [Candidatus Neomarinimicrobiota bacterium]HCX15085.1 hypothetical protein [Rhodospirillaceae bacterium]